MYGNQNLIKAYKAAAQIAPYLIVKFTANPGEVTPGAAAADKMIGVSVPSITVPRASASTWSTRASRR
jgi:hypothetical protein